MSSARRRGAPPAGARPPRHWIKRPPRPSRPSPSLPLPARNGPRRILVTAAAAVVTGFVAAYVAANTLPEPEMTMLALGFGAAIGGAIAWRALGPR